MEVRERWVDESILRASYEHQNARLLPKQVLSEFCDDRMTRAIRFLKTNLDVTSEPTTAAAESIADAVLYDDRSIVWVAANQEELYKLYPNEFILVQNESVIAHSSDPLQLQVVAQQHGIIDAFMTKVIRPSPPRRAIYAGQII